MLSIEQQVEKLLLNFCTKFYDRHKTLEAIILIAKELDKIKRDHKDNPELEGK